MRASWVSFAIFQERHVRALLKNIAGYYFFHPYNARLAAPCGIGSSFSDLSLARIKSRLSKKLIKKFWVFRLATMFYAPVNRLPVQRVVLLPALTLGNC